VQGKLQSGAISGLSHFRGQGAKGDAPKQYIQALKSATEDQTSSMELDRIPADAREMVKDYFTKLKKDSADHLKNAVAPMPPGSEPVVAPTPKTGH